MKYVCDVLILSCGAAAGEQQPFLPIHCTRWLLAFLVYVFKDLFLLCIFFILYFYMHFSKYKYVLKLQGFKNQLTNLI